MRKDLFLGIDIGSVSVKTVLLDSGGGVLTERYERIKGDPASTLRSELAALTSDLPEERIAAAGITGSGGKPYAGAIGASFINEILSQAAFAKRLHPGTRTIIEMGGEDAKLIRFAGNGKDGTRIEDFAMNAACAAGTGSFLDQQAHRLHLSIEAFSELTLRSKKPPAIAGRCSVFAKSDMIHLQQIATPDHDIVAGLCFAMARNYKATVGRGRSFVPPVLFLGGVAANLGMRRAFREVLGFRDGEMLVPEHFNTSGAIGAALMVMDQAEQAVPYRGLSALAGLRAADRSAGGPGMGPLGMPEGIIPNTERDAPSPNGIVDAYLGVDVGSVSTNVVVIDRDLRVLSKRYLPTAGRPIEAVKQGLAEVGGEVAHRVRIMGAATTGSGRHLTGDMIGADLVRNEITAQATAAAAIDPRVDTIFEIGGQDSKYISLRDGAVVDFEMNKACAAGTGSFLEEQAERLGIRIREEFADRAFRAASPCRLGERCTVFMESDLVHYLNRNAGVEELTAGLAYSIAHNYLNKVVAGKRVGEHIFFQGGVAANRAVVAAFERITGKPVTVPPHHEVTGAIGVAIIALREQQGRQSGFKGFDLSRRAYTVSTFTCAECSNRCDIRRVSFEGEQPLFYGSRCEKYDVKRRSSDRERPEDLFAERDRILSGSLTPSPEQGGPVIGIPRALYVNDQLPFWNAFFLGLGFRVVLSDRTSRSTITAGLEASAAETCFPAKVALGHVQDLIAKNVDILFLPSTIRFPALMGQNGSSQACPYAQSLPYIARAALRLGGTRVLDPPVHAHDERILSATLLEIGRSLGRGNRAVRRAAAEAKAAQQRFETALEERGRAVLAGLTPGAKAIVIIGRTYNACDPAMSLNLSAKIRDLGVQAVPLDLLPLHRVDLSDIPNMYWRSGQKILAAARTVREHPDLYPLYLTNFGCGPDSFITHLFRKEMCGKPFLQLELDEHSADAGAITRIEAFLDSLRNAAPAGRPQEAVRRTNGSGYRRKVLLPAMADHAHVIAAAFKACGIDSEVLPESDEETVRLGKEHSSGRECYPLALTTGDMIKALRRPDFDPDRMAFFMPSGKGPCRFGQYNHYQRLLLDGLGYPRVPVIAPMQDESMYREMGAVGKDFIRRCWQGSLAVDILQKMLHEHRPYEKQRGGADALYQASLRELARVVEARADLLPVLRQAEREFDAASETGRGKPVIGVVGEIYIRGNRFGNENIVRKIESLGGEAWVVPLSEWLLYLNETAKVSARMSRSWGDVLKAFITHWFQMRDEHRFLRGLNGTLRSLREPRIEETLALARPYIHPSFEGEAVLSVGKTIDFLRRGVAGIVNVMPFTCMPGTITNAVLKRLREEQGAFPFLNIAYDGQQDSQTLTRLEAFMHQAREHSK